MTISSYFLSEPFPPQGCGQRPSGGTTHIPKSLVYVEISPSSQGLRLETLKSQQSKPLYLRSLLNILHWGNEHRLILLKAARWEVGERVKKEISGEGRPDSISKVTPNHNTNRVLNVSIEPLDRITILKCRWLSNCSTSNPLMVPHCPQWQFEILSTGEVRSWHLLKSYLSGRSAIRMSRESKHSCGLSNH